MASLHSKIFNPLEHTWIWLLWHYVVVDCRLAPGPDWELVLVVPCVRRSKPTGRSMFCPWTSIPSEEMSQGKSDSIQWIRPAGKFMIKSLYEYFIMYIPYISFLLDFSNIYGITSAISCLKDFCKLLLIHHLIVQLSQIQI